MSVVSYQPRNQDETLEKLLAVFAPKDKLTSGQTDLFNAHVHKLMDGYYYAAYNETMRIVAVSKSRERCEEMAIARGYSAPCVVHFRSKSKESSIVKAPNGYFKCST